MKKLIALTTALLLVCSLSACVVIDNGTTPPQTGETENLTNTTGQIVQTQPTEQAVSGEATIQETVLLDASGVKITARELTNGGLFGPELKLLIENNTAKNLTFQNLNCSVNGYMVESMMSVDVAAGKKANDSITFLSSSLDACGIETIADIEFSFNIFGTEDWTTYLETDPVQLQTSAAAAYQYTYDDSGEVVYEGNGIKIVSKGFSKEDTLLGPSLMLYIHNSTEGPVTIQTRSCSINGFMVDPIFSQDVGAGKHAVTALTFMESQLQENSISKITDVELSFHLFDTDSWAGIADSDPITLKFS